MNLLLSLVLITTCALAESAEHSTATVQDDARSAGVVLAGIGNPLPSADRVVAKMLERDAWGQSELSGYTAVRRYGGS